MGGWIVALFVLLGACAPAMVPDAPLTQAPEAKPAPIAAAEPGLVLKKNNF